MPVDIDYLQKRYPPLSREEEERLKQLKLKHLRTKRLLEVCACVFCG